MKLLNVLLERKLIVGLLMTFILGIGAYAMTQLEQELLPPISMDGGVVYLQSGSLSSLEVEERVTTIAEQRIENVDGLDSYSSTSTEGLTVIQFFTDEGEGDDVSREIESILNSAMTDMPVTDMALYQFSTDQPYEFFMDISGGSLEEMTAFAKDIMKPRLEALPEVRDISFSGLEEKQWELAFDEDKLVENELTASQVVEYIQQVNFAASLGVLEEEASQPSYRWDQSFQSIDDLMDTRLGAVQIRDIAKAEEITPENVADAWKNGDSGFIFTEIGRSEGVTQIEMAAAVRDEVQLMREEELISGFNLEEIVAQADYVQDSIDGVTQNVLYGGIIALFVLLLFLRSVRATLIVALSIPLALLLTFATMWFIGYSFNMLSMIALGLGIGMMIDASIVILEAIYRKKEEGYQGKEAVITGVKEVASAVIASVLTTVVVFLPIGLFSGEMGAFIIVLSLVVAITLISALLIAFTLIPALAENFLKLRKTSVKTSENKVIKAYGSILRWVSVKKRRSLSVISLFIIILGSSLFLTTKIPVSLMPDMLNRYSELMIGVEDGVSTSEREDIADAIHLKLQDIEDVEGYTVMDSQEYLYVLVNMTKEDDITLPQEEVNENIFAELRELEEDFPITSVGDAMDMGGQQPVQLTIQGEDFEELRSIADNLQEELETVDGVTNIVSSFQNQHETEQIVLNNDALEEDGISSMTIFENISATDFQEAITEVPSTGDSQEYIPVYLASEERPKTKKEILDLTVLTMNGEKSLANYISFNTLETPNQIERIDGERSVKVTASIENRDLGSVNSDIQELLTNREDVPGYDVQLGGDLQQQQEAMTDLLAIFAISLFLVYVVMAVQFNSLKHPLIIMAIIPFTATGVILGLLITQHELSIISAMGLLMLIGIVLNNAILLVDRTNQLRRKGYLIKEAVIQAGQDRLRPIFITSITTIGGLLPLAVLGGASAGYQAPLATVVISGLLFATAITLLLTPSIYLLVERDKPKAKQAKSEEKVEQAS